MFTPSSMLWRSTAANPSSPRRGSARCSCVGAFADRFGIRAAFAVTSAIFAVGRVPGWTVQVLEQFENNILIRPLTLYNGPEPREYVPIGDR
mgnify:CR=1 FL=1